jgi:hypothetical protein
MDRIYDVTVPGVREKFETWIRDRGGVQVWENLNLSNPGAGRQFTPAEMIGLGEDGKPTPSPAPHWSVGRGEVVTSIDRFRFVASWAEVKRFRVAIRRGAQGFTLKCTDASSAKIHKALEKYPGSTYRFDYDHQEAVIEVPTWTS